MHIQVTELRLKRKLWFTQ